MILLWASHSSNNGYGISLKLKIPITMATMSYLMTQSINTIAIKRGRLRFFLELVPSIRTRDLSVPFKLLYIGIVHSWCMLHCIGMRYVLMIYLSVIFLLRIWFRFITDFLARNHASLLYNF